MRKPSPPCAACGPGVTSDRSAAMAARSGPAAQPEPPATRIRDITEQTERVHELHGTLRLKQNVRAIAQRRRLQLLGGHHDNGPLAHVCTKVMSVELHSGEGGVGRGRIKVFFYDSWAENLNDLLQNNQKLTICGPPEMMRAHDTTDALQHPCTLVVAPHAVLGAGAISIRVTREDINNPEMQYHLDIDDPLSPDLPAQIQSFLSKQAARRSLLHRQYEYTGLGDISLDRHAGKEVHVYALVVSFSLPKPTSGSDMLVSMVLVDPSRADPRQGVVCNTFRPGEQQETFPALRFVGDIVRCHRLKVQSFQGKVQLLGQKHSHFLVVSRSSDAPRLPPTPPEGNPDWPWVDAHWTLTATSREMTFGEADHEQIRRLWAWREGFLATTSVVHDELRTVKLCTVHEALQLQTEQSAAGAQALDVIALVVAKTADSVGLWDGTGERGGGPRFNVPQSVVESLHEALTLAVTGPSWRDLAAQEGAGPPLPLDTQVPSKVELARGVVVLGTRLGLSTPPEHKARFDRLRLQPAMWVRVKNLGSAGGIGVSTAINGLPTASLDVHRVAVRFLRRFLQWRRDTAVPLCLAILNQRRGVHLTGSPLAYVDEALSSSPGALFALRVRMVSWWPNTLADLTRKIDGQWRWFFTIRLSDMTGELDAFVFSDVAEWLLGGLKPLDLRSSQKEGATSQGVLKVLEGKRAAYCQESRWVEMVVRSYSVRRPQPSGPPRLVKRFKLLNPEVVKAQIARRVVAAEQG